MAVHINNYYINIVLCGKWRNIYNLIELQLYMNEFLVILYKIYVFYVEQESKMVATAKHSLT